MKVLVIDAVGMVGHVVALYFKENGHEVIGYNETPCELVPSIEGSFYNTIDIEKTIEHGGFDAVINCSAIINQDAETDKAGAAFINTYLPHFLEKLTAGSNTILVHRSTDCIYSGNRGQYTLADMPDETSFYARTKAVGEVVNDKDITIRTSLIGPDYKKDGRGLFNWFFNQEGEVNGFANAIWTGLTTIEFARQIETLLNMKAHGLFQLVPDCAISKYDLLLLFEKYFPGSRTINRVENRRVDKSLLPETNGYKILIPNYDVMVQEMLSWIKSHKKIYSNYY